MPADSPSVQKVALEPWEVGAELLDILSRGSTQMLGTPYANTFKTVLTPEPLIYSSP